MLSAFKSDLSVVQILQTDHPNDKLETFGTARPFKNVALVFILVLFVFGLTAALVYFEGKSIF